MKEGSAMPKGCASSLMLAGPLPSRPITARRVGSASAWKTVFSCSLILFHKAKYHEPIT